MHTNICMYKMSNNNKYYNNGKHTKIINNDPILKKITNTKSSIKIKSCKLPK